MVIFQPNKSKTGTILQFNNYLVLWPPFCFYIHGGVITVIEHIPFLKHNLKLIIGTSNKWSVTFQKFARGMSL